MELVARFFEDGVRSEIFGLGARQKDTKRAFKIIADAALHVGILDLDRGGNRFIPGTDGVGSRGEGDIDP